MLATARHTVGTVGPGGHPNTEATRGTTNRLPKTEASARLPRFEVCSANTNDDLL